MPRRLKHADLEGMRRIRGRSALLFLTDRCPVGCAHCSVDSRPDSPTISDFALFEEIVGTLCAAPELELVGISGGEPFVERRGLALASERLVAAGKLLVVYTSGIWAGGRVAPWIHDVFARCSAVVLSTDAFHADAMPDERFVRAARTIAEHGVWMVVQVVRTPGAPERVEALLEEALGAAWGDDAELHLVQPLPYGRGAGLFAHGKPTPGRDYGPCLVSAAPVVRYDGATTGCCNELVAMGAGPSRLRRASASASELATALEHFRTDPLLRAIESVGPGALTSLPEYGDLADARFASICDLCWRILDRAGEDAPPPLVRALDLVGAAS